MKFHLIGIHDTETVQKHMNIRFYRRFPDPLQRFYTHFMYMPLDEQKMKEAAEYIVGEHDFASFCSAGSQVDSTVRTVYSLSVNKRDDVISIRITGNGFLYNMVRIIVGTLIKVGLGVYPPEHVKEIIEAKDRYVAGTLKLRRVVLH